MLRTALAYFMVPAILFRVVWLIATISSGCASQRPRVTTDLIAAARAYSELEQAHHDLYEAEVTRLREASKLVPDGGARASYETALVPMQAEYDARTEALVHLNADLLSAGRLLDAAKAGDKEGVLEAARAAQRSLQLSVERLEIHRALPPVPIPASVRKVIADLSALVAPEGVGSPAPQDDVPVIEGLALLVLLWFVRRRGEL